MNTNEKLTAKELEELKAFSSAWLRTYSFMPPEAILTLYLLIFRIVEHHNRQVAQIQNISIAQVSTVSDMNLRLRHIEQQSIGRSML